MKQTHPPEAGRATSNELRQIAEFLRGAANRMDELGDDYDHEHLADHAEGFDSSTDLIAIQAK